MDGSFSPPAHSTRSLARTALHGATAFAPATRRVSTALLLLLLCGVTSIQQWLQDFQADDAFISYRYAANWVRGNGPVFNPGERVEGYSNFLMVGFQALTIAAGGDPVSASRALGTLASWGAILLVYVALRRVLGRSRRIALAGSAILALHAGVAVFARSGLETVPLAAMVLLAQVTLLMEHRRGRRHWVAGLLFGVAALLRVDAGLYAAVALAWLLVLRADRRALASLLLPFLLVFLPWFAWRWSYYGSLLPNTYFVRMGGGIQQQLRGLYYVFKFVEPFGGIFLFGLPLVLLVRRDPGRDAARLLFALTVAAVACFVVWVGGDYMPMARFFIPVVPALTLLLVEAVGEVVDLTPAIGPTPARRRGILAFILLCLVALSGLLPALAWRREPESHVIETRAQARQWALAGQWFREHAPDRLLASEPTGAIGFYSGLRIIDMLGVNDAHIAHLEPPNLGRGTSGHEKSDFDYVLSRRPDFIFRGVHDAACIETSTQQRDGSTYRLRCAPLGRGEFANRFGERRWTDLYLWYEEREPHVGDLTHP